MLYENREFYIDCDGVKIHSKLDFPKEQKEKMPILVVIPGFTGHIEEEHILAVKDTANEAGFAVLRAEMYGHGLSDGDFYDHTLLLWMSEGMRVVRYASKLPFVSDVYLSGHSQGGLNAVLVAGIMSDVVKVLIPMSPAMCIVHDAKKGNTLGIEYDTDDLPEYLESPDWKLSGDYIRVAKIIPVKEAVEQYKGEVFIIHGTKDSVVPYEDAVNLADDYENARLVPIEDADHCYEEHLPEFTAVLKDFLESKYRP
ncbi:MAG: alpha/beta hydrolase [Lachnospiraceae bacterium]|nr:alpha/beta hydrolase [Lachnospiraceae bacterium]